MNLEIHDDEVGNTLAGRVKNIDYDYQAEQWVQDTMTDEVNRAVKAPHALDKFILMDDEGQRAVWKVLPNGDVELVEKADRFTGQWQMKIPFTPKKKGPLEW